MMGGSRCVDLVISGELESRKSLMKPLLMREESGARCRRRLDWRRDGGELCLELHS